MIGMEQYQGLALQQTLSPQMQQSLHILQAPLMELRQLVAAELESNPVLEEDARAVSADERAAAEPARSELQDEWREYFSQRASAEPWTAEAIERRQHFLDSQTRPVSLTRHMMDQLGEADMDAETRGIAAVIIGNVDSRGYLRETLEDIGEQAGCTVEAAGRVLEVVQQMEPAGVAARDLRECLLLQLKRDGRESSLEGRIVRDHLEDLGRRKLPDIARQLRVGVPDAQRAAEAIARLEPRPGRQYAWDEEQTIVADVVVERDGDDWVVALNDSEIPALRVGDDYKDMLSQSAANAEVRDYLREKIRGGRFFIKCIQQRHQTLLNIAREIVVRQRAFFDLGPAHLRPMTMSQVAESVGVHETTVSRAVSGKYLSSPRGLFEMKYFFTSGYATTGGGSMSNESVRQHISEIIRCENTRSPLSDQDIVVALSDSGVPVARRTVAKYREQLGILPSHLRKSF